MTSNPDLAAPAAGMPAALPPVLAPELPPVPGPLRAAITAAWLRDEGEHVAELLAAARQPRPGWGDADRAAIKATAAERCAGCARDRDQGAIEAFMRQYDLGSEEACC